MIPAKELEKYEVVGRGASKVSTSLTPVCDGISRWAALTDVFIISISDGLPWKICGTVCRHRCLDGDSRRKGRRSEICS